MKIKKKLNEILDHFKAFRKNFYLTPIRHFYLFSFKNSISLSKNVAHFSFKISMKKVPFSKIVLHFAEL